MADNIIKVGMADLNYTRHPGILVTLGLGSCVGIALYDKKNKNDWTCPYYASLVAPGKE